MQTTNLNLTARQKNSEEQAFLQLNGDVYNQLVTFLDFAPESLTIGFVAIDFSRDQQTLLDLLEKDDRCQDVQLEIFHFDDPTLRFLRDKLIVELPKRLPIAGKKLVVVITGLENSVGLLGEYPPVLQDLNYVRDGFTSSVPHPLLICVPDTTLTRIARFAPDFWAWKRAVLQFKPLPATVDAAIAETERRSQSVGNLNQQSKQSQIDLLLRLLTCHGNRDLSFAERQNHIQPWNSLGMLYEALGKWEQAITAFNKALEIIEQVGTTIDKIATLGNLATVLFRQGNSDWALDLWNRVLELAERVDNRSKAKALHGIASIKYRQGLTEEAMLLWQKALQLRQQAGDLEGQATTLNAVAWAAAQQGGIRRAIDLWEESLKISERTGNLETKADTLYGLAGIARLKGDIDRGLQLWNESLKLQEYSGNAQGKAATLAMMGQLQASQGDFEPAIAALQKSIAILQRIQSYEVSKAEEMLEQVMLMALLQSSPELQQLPESGDEAAIRQFFTSQDSDKTDPD
jgi:tetratricopeptide (TPR) repeat protein